MSKAQAPEKRDRSRRPSARAKGVARYVSRGWAGATRRRRRMTMNASLRNLLLEQLALTTDVAAVTLSKQRPCDAL